MKEHKTLRWIAILMGLTLLATGPILAQGGYDLTWWTVDGGGATVSSGEGYTLGGTIGQPDAGTLSGEDYTVIGGFWSFGVGAPPAICQITGTVLLQGRSDHGGVTIHVDGTPMATTDSGGGFTAANLAPGTHTVRAAHPGYLTSEAASVSCPASQTTELPPTTLLGGDANRDCVINLFDLVLVGAAYGTCEGDPAFDPRADINGDGCVNLFDLVLVAANYGRGCPIPWAAPVTFGLTQVEYSLSAPGQPPWKGLAGSEQWSLQVVDARDIYGLDIRIAFDPTAVRVVDADPERGGVQVVIGSLLADRPHFVAENRVTVDEGRGKGVITLVATLLRPAQPIRGSGSLAVVLFEPVELSEAAPSPFTIEDMRLVALDGGLLAVDWKENALRSTQKPQAYLPLILKVR